MSAPCPVMIFDGDQAFERVDMEPYMRYAVAKSDALNDSKKTEQILIFCFTWISHKHIMRTINGTAMIFVILEAIIRPHNNPIKDADGIFLYFRKTIADNKAVTIKG